MVVDSNIIIYAADPANQYLRDFIRTRFVIISSITIIETLGYHRLTKADEEALQFILDNAVIVDVDRQIINIATGIRRRINISVADAVIAATALYYDFELATNNEDDFKNVSGLKVINPLKPF